MKVQLLLDAQDNNDLATLQSVLASLNLSAVAAPSLPSTSSLVIPPAPAPVVAAAPVVPAAPIVPPAPAAPAEAPEEAADANAPLVDNFGVAFDPSIHSSSRKIHIQGALAGRFHKKRGGHDDLYNAKYAGRTVGAAAPAPVVPAPVPAPSLETPVNPLAMMAPPAPIPAPAPAPVAQAAAPVPGALTSASITTPPGLFQFFSQMTGRKDRPLPPALGNEVLKQFGLDNLVSVASRALTDPNLVPTLAYTLEQRDTQWLATGA